MFGLILNCIVTPSFLLSKSKYVSLVVAEFVDCCFGLYFSVILPAQFVIRSELKLNALPIGQSSNWEAQVGDLMASNVMQVDSFERILVFLVFPFVLCHFGFNTVLMDTAITVAEKKRAQRSSSVAVSDHRKSINVAGRVPILVAVGLYTIFLSTMSGFAVFGNECPQECKVPLFNLFSNSCHCLSWTVNCKSIGLQTLDSVNSYVTVTIPEEVVVLRFHECPIDDVPSALYPRFKDLITLELYDTMLTKFSLNLRTHFEKLRAYSVVKAPLEELPDGLLDYPKNLREFRISQTPLKKFPRLNAETLVIRRMYLENGNFTEFPSTADDFDTVLLFSISGNPIGELNVNALSHNMLILIAVDTNLTIVDPKLLTALPFLREVHFENNFISQIPESVQLDMLEKWSIIGLTHNPVCETKGALLPELYERACTQETCSPSCLYDINFQNSHCDTGCNVEACDYDGGDCDLYNSKNRIN